MARLFDDGSNEYLSVNQAITGTPLAMVSWFNTNDSTVEQSIVSISDESVDAHYHRLTIVSGNHIRAQTCESPAGCSHIDSSTEYSVDTWHHACAIFVSSTDRRILLDAAGRGTNTGSRTPVNLDITSVGRTIALSAARYMSGMIAETAIYDLSQWPGATDSDRADNFEKILPSLANGDTPDTYPLGLVAYYNLVRGLNDKFGGYNLTATGTVVATHPRIISPCGVL